MFVKKSLMIRTFLLLLCCALFASTTVPVRAEDDVTVLPNPVAFAQSTGLTIEAKAAVLMDAESGTVLFSQNAEEPLPPASVTKVMTLLLIAEAIDDGRLSLSDPVTVSSRAASMGGSQIFLESGEVMCVEDLFKSVVMASANDAACALAEHLCGSEEAFVARMNERAKELGMVNSHFENTNGLDDTTVNHKTSAMDIAIMSRELLSHAFIRNYTTLWMDSVRNGEFTLTNTNRLVRFYPGCTGLKTGSTEKAQFCISASAERNGLHLIAVIMGASSRDRRNEEAKKLLDFGFANYACYRDPGISLPQIRVFGGVSDHCGTFYEPWCTVVEKGKLSSIEILTEMEEGISAPIRKGERIGKVCYRIGDAVVHESEIVAAESIEHIGIGELFYRMLQVFVGG